jgi:hypothetical protein
MKEQTGKLLVVESDDAFRETLIAVFRDSGYEVSTDHSGGNDERSCFRARPRHSWGGFHRNWIAVIFFLKSRPPGTLRTYVL